MYAEGLDFDSRSVLSSSLVTISSEFLEISSSFVSTSILVPRPDRLVPMKKLCGTTSARKPLKSDHALGLIPTRGLGIQRGGECLFLPCGMERWSSKCP